MITKAHVHAKMVQLLDDRISSLRSDIDSSVESRNSATKSSAGDKHETARAMLQIELENKEAQFQKTVKQRYDLMQLDPDSNTSKIEWGSLVFTSSGVFYLSISLGKISFGSEEVYAISPASPLGTALLNSAKSKKIIVNKTETLIHEVN